MCYRIQLARLIYGIYRQTYRKLLIIRWRRIAEQSPWANYELWPCASRRRIRISIWGDHRICRCNYMVWHLQQLAVHVAANWSCTRSTLPLRNYGLVEWIEVGFWRRARDTFLRWKARLNTHQSPCSHPKSLRSNPKDSHDHATITTYEPYGFLKLSQKGKQKVNRARWNFRNPARRNGYSPCTGA